MTCCTAAVTLAQFVRSASSRRPSSRHVCKAFAAYSLAAASVSTMGASLRQLTDLQFFDGNSMANPPIEGSLLTDSRRIRRVMGRIVGEKLHACKMGRKRLLTWPA